jgi:hypothetical protein
MKKSTIATAIFGALLFGTLIFGYFKSCSDSSNLKFLLDDLLLKKLISPLKMLQIFLIKK